MERKMVKYRDWISDTKMATFNTFKIKKYPLILVTWMINVYTRNLNAQVLSLDLGRGVYKKVTEPLIND